MAAGVGLLAVVALSGAYLLRDRGVPAGSEVVGADAPMRDAIRPPAGAGEAGSPPAATSKGAVVPAAVDRAQRPAASSPRPDPVTKAPAVSSPPAAGEEARAAPPAAPPAPGADVILTGSYPFEVYSDGRLASASSTEHRVRVSGRQSLQLKAPEYFLDAPVVVDPGTRHVQAPELGRLQLRIPEVCSATLGGRDLGEPPYPEMQIAGGSYRVQMKCPDGSTRNVPIVVRPGELRSAIIAK